jgi:hypothetical protein
VRRLLPQPALATRGPFLALSLVCLVLALVLFGTGHGVGAVTALIAAFLLVAVAKRA